MRADSSEGASTETLGALNDSSLGCALGTFSQTCLCLCVFEERRAERTGQRGSGLTRSTSGSQINEQLYVHLLKNERHTEVRRQADTHQTEFLKLLRRLKIFVRDDN